MLSIGVLVAIYSFSKNNNKKSISSTSSIPSNINITPGSKSSEKYTELQQVANLTGTKKAEAQGKTFIPTIINSANDQLGKSFEQQLSSLLKEKEGTEDYEKLSKQLAELLAQLNRQGQEIDNLLRLIRELQKQGYDISDLEKLLAMLRKQGYNDEELAKLLAMLKNQGYAINDLENLLKRLLQEGYNKDLISKILEDLLRDRLKALEDLLKKLQEAGLNTNNADYLKQIDDPDLSALLSQLANQGYKIDSLEELLKQLMKKGYNIFNLSILLNQLKKDGYKVETLQNVLKQGEKSGKVKDLSDLFKTLSKKKDNPQPPKEKSPPNQIKPNLTEAESKYAEIVKQQQDKAMAAIQEQKNKETAFKAKEEKQYSNQQSTINSETRRKDMEALFANMNTVADSLSKSLNETPQQQFVEGEFKKDTKEVESVQSMNLQLVDSNNNKGVSKKDKIIKAGTILFAVLESAVNSDEPGPILARIVQPPLQNASLLGTIQPSGNQYAEGLVLNFTNISIPDRIRSYGISAVAIDPNTSRTSIATDVDHHYLLRWGTIFAASFLQGYSKAIAQSATTVSSSTNGATSTTTTQQSPLNPKQQVHQGLANVASTWGQGAATFTNRPNTITINTGTSLGILLTADFTVPSSDEAPTDDDVVMPVGKNQQKDKNLQNLGPTTNSPETNNLTKGQVTEEKNKPQNNPDTNNKSTTGGN